MTPWPAIPDLPGHVVETGRREDGARRRLDLFVHPEGVQPHHVAIRLDLWEGRAPELHAGFGAEARPVCLPEHLDPQEVAVEAAARLVEEVAGDAAAARLRGLWEAARGRLEGRIREITARDEHLCRFIIGGAHQPGLACRPTRPFERRDHGMVLNRGEARYCGTASRRAPPLTPSKVLAAHQLSAHQKLALLAAPKLHGQRLRDGFANMSGSPVFAVPSALDGWIAWAGARHLDLAPTATPCLIKAIGPEGQAITLAAERTYDKTELKPSLHIHYPTKYGELLVTVANGATGDRKLGKMSLQWLTGDNSRANGKENLVEAMQTLLSMIVGLDLDLGGEPVPRRNVSRLKALAAHSKAFDLDWTAAVEPFVARLLGAPYERLCRKIDARRGATP